MTLNVNTFVPRRTSRPSASPLIILLSQFPYWKRATNEQMHFIVPSDVSQFPNWMTLSLNTGSQFPNWMTLNLNTFVPKWTARPSASPLSILLSQVPCWKRATNEQSHFIIPSDISQLPDWMTLRLYTGSRLPNCMALDLNLRTESEGSAFGFAAQYAPIARPRLETRNERTNALHNPY